MGALHESGIPKSNVIVEDEALMLVIWYRYEDTPSALNETDHE